jgi:catechol 2,3-dioxygenase-like lactoylglutathione lyase family enzyme
MIKAQDIAYAAFRVPDLGRMEAFLTDFGMVRAEKRNDRLFMRGAGTYPYINIIERGEPAGFAAVGIVARSADDLARLAQTPGASAVEALDAPGGGQRVRLRAPDGYQVDVVHGIGNVAPLPVRSPLALNYALDKNRKGSLQRPAKEPARVVRLGHCVFKASDAEATIGWFERTLGMLRTDRLHLPDNDKATLGVFLRFDRGGDYTDHHSIFVLHDPEHVKLHHSSYEVQDYDAVHIGHMWMKERGWTHEWGIGRHLLGSQVFDYWRDPWGNMFEHYADGDLVTADVKPGNYAAVPENLAQWGPMVTPTFFN